MATRKMIIDLSKPNYKSLVSELISRLDKGEKIEVELINVPNSFRTKYFKAYPQLDFDDCTNITFNCCNDTAYLYDDEVHYDRIMSCPGCGCSYLLPKPKDENATTYTREHLESAILMDEKYCPREEAISILKSSGYDIISIRRAIVQAVKEKGLLPTNLSDLITRILSYIN